MTRVLVLCTGNSCRSQMAEAIWRQLGGGRWECHSAGTEPADRVHPLALAVLAEAGIPVQDPRPRHVQELTGERFDVVITVCDSAREACPVYPDARETLHWPFYDPALATGSDEDRMAVFRQVRDAIRAVISGYLDAIPRRFSDWMHQLLDQWPGECPVELRERYRMLITRTGELLSAGLPLWPQLTGVIRELFQERGWEWNGIYVLDGDSSLRLAYAAGPPACAQIERKGGVGTSGMCFDAVSMNQTLVAADVARWPGYVSCDGDSGIATCSGMVCPIRDATGAPVAVWDVDATRPLAVADAVFFDRYFATLGSLLNPTRRDLDPTTSSPSGARVGEDEPAIQLAQFLKWQGLAETGGRAKLAIQKGLVRVNGELETRRSRRLRQGDVVEIGGERLVVDLA